MSRWRPLLVLLVALALGLVLHQQTGSGPCLGLDLSLSHFKALFNLDQSPERTLDQTLDQTLDHTLDQTQDQTRSLEQRISSAWENIITPPQRRWRRAAVGVNSCVDVVVSGVDLLKALGLSPGSGPGLDHEVLSSLQDLREAFEFFMSRGAAAERFFSDGDLFHHIAVTAVELKGAQFYVGGNAALIGQKLASSPDVEVLLSGPVGPKLHELLEEKIVVPPESLRETDEFHLILEYQTGEQWGPLVVAPQANRFIFSHDESNNHMTFTEALVQSLDQFEPDLMVLSGLHMMEGLKAETRDQRLDQVVALLSQLSVPIHLELASMTDPSFMHRIIEQVFPLVSSLGLNEQELLFLSRSVEGPHADVIWSEVGVASAVGVASDVLSWVLQQFGAVYGESQLSRIHFHSLPFHVVAVVTGGRWGNQAASTAAGARAASAQACGRSHIEPITAHQLRTPLTFSANATHMLTLDPDRPVTEWQHGHVTLHLSPVLVCKRPIRTVGLGDAISANGLLFSEIAPPL